MSCNTSHSKKCGNALVVHPVWISKQGYRHKTIGQKVSQLQAVLVRRCAAIGELQQHLLRSGLQQGVAQWGVIGHGGQWAAMAGFDGRMKEKNDNHYAQRKSVKRRNFSRSSLIRTLSTEFKEVSYSEDPIPHVQPLIEYPQSRINSGGNRGKVSPYRSNVLVRKGHGGGIFVDDPGRLAEWSIDAIYLIRKHLYRSGNGMITLPFESNWVVIEEERVPTWAEDVKTTASDQSSESHIKHASSAQLTISNLPLLVAEVEGLLDIMENVMDVQRRRRLEVLKPPRWMRRNWYLLATSIPAASSLALWMIRNGNGKRLFQSLARSVTSFIRERLRDPVIAM